MRMPNDKRLIDVISKSLSLKIDEINIDSDIEKIPSWDSLMSLQLMTRLEKEFSIKIPLYKFIKAKTLKDILILVN